MVAQESEQNSNRRLLVLSSFAWSLVHFRGEMLKSFVKLGYEVHAAAPDMSPEISHELEAIGCVPHEISLSRQGINPLRDLIFLWRVFCLFRRIRPSVFLGYAIKPVIYGNLAAWAAGVPKRTSLIPGLGFSFSEGGSRSVGFIKKTARLLYKAALSKTHYVLFQNGDDLQLFRDLGLVTHQKTGIINGSGVDISIFSPVELPKRPVFLLMARLIVEKGVREYIEASKIVVDQIPHSRFMIAGQFESGPSAISKTQFRQWVDSSPVEYLGILSDVRPVIAKASVYVLPSYYREGTPRTVLEAMAMGRPIVTCDTPGCRETVVEGENGLMVPAKSVKLLSDAMLRLGNDSDLRVAMGQKGRQMVVQRYDVRKVNESIIRYLELD